MSEKKIDAKAEKTPAKASAKKKKTKVFSKLASFFRECKAELKKIVWPAPKATTKNFLVVLVTIVVVGLIIFGLDQGLYALLGLIMDVSAT